jgi:hypothetical protein
MNLENINRQILKVEKTKGQDNALEQKLARELFKSKTEKKLRPQDKADILTLRLSPDAEKYFSPQRLQYLKSLQNLASNDELLNSIIPNKHYFFLSELREKKFTKPESIYELAKNYKISSEELQKLKEDGFVDWLEKPERNLTKENKDELIKRGFLSSLSDHDKFVLEGLEGKEITTQDILAQNPDLTEGRLNQLRIKGHIDILSQDDVNFLMSGAKAETLSKHNLELHDYYRLKDRIEFHERGGIKLVDESNLSIKEKEFLNKYLSGEIKVKDAPTLYSFTEDHIYKLISRIEKFAGNEIKSIDLAVHTNVLDKFDAEAKVYYREKLPVLNFREKFELAYSPSFSPLDTSIYLRGTNLEHLSKRELDRFHELLAFKETSFASYAPSNTELAFLRRINGRKGDLELLIKIGTDDFGLPKDSIYHLLESQLISMSNGYINNEWIEPESLAKARIWQSTTSRHSFEESIHVLSLLKIKEPPQLLKDLLQNNRSYSPQQKLEDYELFLKVHFKTNLNYFESQRLHHLRENGIHPELNASFLKDDPASWKMKAARKQSFIHHFKERYHVDIKVLEFINKFKQVTHDQLIKLGLTEGEIERYVRGIVNEDVPFGGKLLNRHTLNTPKGNILYYSIQHQGIVSGRSLLETRMGKEFIAQRPQQRQDLLFHDLKVVDCVLVVQKELEDKGCKILEIKNESSQYSDAKAGKGNDWRKDGPSFMDAVLIVEEPVNEFLSISGGGTSTIAVEYGNYTNERMMSKIANSDFDQAFVFSNQTFQQKYSNMVITKNVVFRTI